MNELRNVIETKQIIPVVFPARTSDSIIVPAARTFTWQTNIVSGIGKPRWIIVGFQVDKIETQEQNPAVFDHLNLTGAQVILNTEKYPQNDILITYSTNDYSVLYEMFDNFKKDYYGYNSLVGGTQVNFSAFKSLFPIIVFDVRRQSEKIKTGIADMRFKFTFSDVTPAGTMAYATIISDRKTKLKSDGKNLIMVDW